MPKGLYIEEGTPNPRLEYNYHYTLNTPSQMQRECNDVAFGELILSTRLNKKENDTSKVQNEKMSSKRATLELVL